MIILAAGLVLFLGIHLLPTLPGMRDALAGRLGERAYRGLFALLSLAGFVLIVWGKARAPFVPVYDPPAWGRYVAPPLMIIAFYLLVGSRLPANIRRHLRHPMLWAVTLWAGVHLLANGDLASILLFGGFLAYAVFDMWSANRRGATTSDRKVSTTRDAIVVIAAGTLYLVFFLAHPVLFGVPIFPGVGFGQ